ATTALNKPVNGNNGSWWRRAFGSAEKPPATTTSLSNPTHPTAPPPKPVEPERPLPSPPQDPVAVDLMKQTQGAVVILLQQSDMAKNTVEMMLQQGSRTWKPSRASKYQDASFAYQKGLNYYFQKDIQPGTYDVLVRIRRGGKSAVQQPFALFGKIAPPGSRSQTYAFGRYGLGGSQDQWTVAGHLVIGANSLQYRAALPMVSESARPLPAGEPSAEPTVPTAPASTPTPDPAKKKRTGKWG
ncbi:MAG: hypothetical protein ABIO24_12855, partial [Saprospiraceae bacterium]